jgi:preprotein translocase subunit SecE
VSIKDRPKIFQTKSGGEEVKKEVTKKETEVRDRKTGEVNREDENQKYHQMTGSQAFFKESRDESRQWSWPQGQSSIPSTAANSATTVTLRLDLTLNQGGPTISRVKENQEHMCVKMHELRACSVSIPRGTGPSTSMASEASRRRGAYAGMCEVTRALPPSQTGWTLVDWAGTTPDHS